jgi:hypothetical protein
MRVRAAVATVVLGLGLAACGGGREAADIASTGGSTTTEAPTSMSTTTTGPSASTSVPASTAGTSTSAVTSTTLRRPTTTRAPATTAVRDTTTTGPPPAPPRCENVALTAVVVLTAGAYRPGEAVDGTYLLRNTSGAACVFRNYSFTSTIVDASGRSVGASGAGHSDGFSDFTFVAGASVGDGRVGWDQRICTTTCTQAPPGSYAVTIAFTISGTVFSGMTTFQLIAA